MRQALVEQPEMRHEYLGYLEYLSVSKRVRVEKV